MPEQREPGWYWVRLGGLWFIERREQTSDDGGCDAIGERIPDNEELIALRAVVEAAERLLLKATSPRNFRRVIDEELDDLKVALARLGGNES